MTKINVGMFNLKDYGLNKLAGDAAAVGIIDKLLNSIEDEYAEYNIDYDIRNYDTSYQIIGHMLSLAFSIMADVNELKLHAGRNLNWETSAIVRQCIYSVYDPVNWSCAFERIKYMLEECVEALEYNPKANHYYSRILIGLTELHTTANELMSYELNPYIRDDIPVATDDSDSTGGCML